ncbi:unnamed protein product, partial [Rotaria sp. Silwood2]
MFHKSSACTTIDTGGRMHRADDHPIEHCLSSPSLTNTDDIFIKAIRKGEDFGDFPRTQMCCVSF